MITYDMVRYMLLLSVGEHEGANVTSVASSLLTQAVAMHLFTMHSSIIRQSHMQRGLHRTANA